MNYCGVWGLEREIVAHVRKPKIDNSVIRSSITARMRPYSKNRYSFVLRDVVGFWFATRKVWMAIRIPANTKVKADQN